MANKFNYFSTLRSFNSSTCFLLKNVPSSSCFEWSVMVKTITLHSIKISQKTSNKQDTRHLPKVFIQLPKTFGTIFLVCKELWFRFTLCCISAWIIRIIIIFFWHDQELLQLIHDNQVVVISGETGCGKTTQVPQFILDHHLENGTGSMCRVICTQPRRISAITVSFYVLHSFRTSAKKKISSLRRKFPQFWEIVLLYVLLSWNRVSRIRETSLLPQSKFSKPSKITI